MKVRSFCQVFEDDDGSPSTTIAGEVSASGFLLRFGTEEIHVATAFAGEGTAFLEEGEREVCPGIKLTVVENTPDPEVPIDEMWKYEMMLHSDSFGCFCIFFDDNGEMLTTMRVKEVEDDGTPIDDD